MKFRVPKTGEVFETLQAAHSNFCSSRECKVCELNNYTSLLDCYGYYHENIEKMIDLMGYEVVEEEVVPPWEEKEVDFMPDTKPHICEVLGGKDNPLEVGEQFGISTMPGVAFWICKDGTFDTRPGGAPKSAYHLLRAVEHPDRIIRKPRLTEEEVADAKVLARALPADGFERDRDGDVFATSSVACRTLLDSRMFPSLHPGQSIRIQDIIASGTQR